MVLALIRVVGVQCQTLVRGLWESLIHLVALTAALSGQYERFRPIRLPNHFRSVLIICKANLCRSPLAEAYLRSKFEQLGRPIVVGSAGLEAAMGRPAHSLIMRVAREHQLDLSQHVTRVISGDLVAGGDLIFVMELSQKVRILRVYPEASGKVLLLGSFDPQGPLEIADPYGKSKEEISSCFAQIRRSCDAFLDRLS